MRELPHMSSDGCSPPQTAGRLGSPKIAQPPVAVSCTQGTPAGLPCGMSGIGELIEGAIQQALHAGRQVIIRFRRSSKMALRQSAQGGL